MPETLVGGVRPSRSWTPITSSRCGYLGGNGRTTK
jgi:hypothetical protein